MGDSDALEGRRGRVDGSLAATWGPEVDDAGARDTASGRRQSVERDVLAGWLAAASVEPQSAPGWMASLVAGVEAVDPRTLTLNDPPATTVGPRQAAVLILFGQSTTTGPDVLLQRRARGLRDHPGEISFPGGGWERGDRSPVETALREAVEETGLDPSGVEPVALLPRLVIPASGFEVTGVVGHWRCPSEVAPVDPVECTEVMRVPLAELADPRNRLNVTNSSGWAGPAFVLRESVIWGYTGEILDALLAMGGWGLPWEVCTAPQDLDDVWASLVA